MKLAGPLVAVLLVLVAARPVVPARDGTVIGGWYVASRNGASVVACHGSGADRRALLDDARALVAAGFGTLLFDMPGNGESGGRVRMGAPERDALLGAVDFLVRQPDVRDGRIGALGFSAGSFTVAQVAPGDRRIRAVVLEGAFGDADQQTRAEYASAGRLAQWAALRVDRLSGMEVGGPRPIDLVARIAPRPLLIVTGTNDHVVPPAFARALYDAAREPKQLWVVPGAKHGAYGEADPRYAERLREFFLRTLSAPDSGTVLSSSHGTGS
jgi:uncharacterized protein